MTRYTNQKALMKVSCHCHHHHDHMIIFIAIIIIITISTTQELGEHRSDACLEKWVGLETNVIQ